jgi:hypothetical protein
MFRLLATKRQLAENYSLAAVLHLLRFPILQLDLRYHKRAREVLFRFVHSNHDTRLWQLRPAHWELRQPRRIAERKVCAEARDVIGQWPVSKGAIF